MDPALMMSTNAVMDSASLCNMPVMIMTTVETSRMSLAAVSTWTKAYSLWCFKSFIVEHHFQENKTWWYCASYHINKPWSEDIFFSGYPFLKSKSKFMTWELVRKSKKKKISLIFLSSSFFFSHLEKCLFHVNTKKHVGSTHLKKRRINKQKKI